MAVKNLIILVLLFPFASLAQSQQEAPKPKSAWINKSTITQLSMLGAVYALDGCTTQQAKWNWKGRETNPILGDGAGPRRITGYFALAFAGSAGSSYMLRRHNRLRWVATSAITAAEAVVISRNISSNRLAARNCPNNPLCTLR